ncbi:uncharacterized protein LOC135290087 [Passer domesticus]|uniref:uncharacterized protein LOC135290087 n=1 Tax=Passer domesticus TaxID=48849 RepID=UPI0030FF1983
MPLKITLSNSRAAKSIGPSCCVSLEPDRYALPARQQVVPKPGNTKETEPGIGSLLDKASGCGGSWTPPQRGGTPPEPPQPRGSCCLSPRRGGGNTREAGVPRPNPRADASPGRDHAAPRGDPPTPPQCPRDSPTPEPTMRDPLNPPRSAPGPGPPEEPAGVAEPLPPPLPPPRTADPGTLTEEQDSRSFWEGLMADARRAESIAAAESGGAVPAANGAPGARAAPQPYGFENGAGHAGEGRGQPPSGENGTEPRKNTIAGQETHGGRERRPPREAERHRPRGEERGRSRGEERGRSRGEERGRSRGKTRSRPEAYWHSTSGSETSESSSVSSTELTESDCDSEAERAELTRFQAKPNKAFNKTGKQTQHKLTDWGKIKIACADWVDMASVHAYPVRVTGAQGNQQRTYTPVNVKEVQTIAKAISEKGINSAVVTTLIDGLFSNDDLLPFDIRQIARMMFDAAGMIVFKQEWTDNCSTALAQASGEGQQLHGSSLTRLLGRHDDVATPQQQAAQLRAEEVRATTRGQASSQYYPHQPFRSSGNGNGDHGLGDPSPRFIPAAEDRRRGSAENREIHILSREISFLTFRGGPAEQAGTGPPTHATRRPVRRLKGGMLFLRRPHRSRQRLHGGTPKQTGSETERQRRPTKLVRILVQSITMANHSNFFPNRSVSNPASSRHLRTVPTEQASLIRPDPLGTDQHPALRQTSDAVNSTGSSTGNAAGRKNPRKNLPGRKTNSGTPNPLSLSSNNLRYLISACRQLPHPFVGEGGGDVAERIGTGGRKISGCHGNLIGPASPDSQR